MSGKENFLDRCTKLVSIAGFLGVPVTISEQYPKGLGKTVNPIIQSNGNMKIFNKMHFSCFEDESICRHIEDLNNSERDQLIIAGIESHVCVLQSAIDFKNKGLKVFVVMDAVASRLKKSVSLAKSRLKYNNIELVNVEMVVFEWLKVSGTSEFKKISNLLK